MPKKITVKAVSNFMGRREWDGGNTSTGWQNGQFVLKLFGNTIAKWDNVLGLLVCDGNYGLSVTIKERLNGLPDVQVHTRNGVDYINDHEWDGGWWAVQYDCSADLENFTVETVEQKVRDLVHGKKFRQAQEWVRTLLCDDQRSMLFNYIDQHQS